MAKQITDADLELLDALGVETAPEQTKKYTAKEERIIAGFEEIERFVEEQGKMPQHGEENDIFERLYAVRLDRLRESKECRELLEPLDAKGLLVREGETSLSQEEEISDDALLEALGVEENFENEITQLTHVRSRKEVKAAEEVAQRALCEDFNIFKPVFEIAQNELEHGIRQTVAFKDNATVNTGDMFILDGQKVLVAEMGEKYINKHGHPERRLRVIFDNGVESGLLLRSLQRALNKDKTSRRIIKPEAGLFADTEEEDDTQTGYIYVLRSLSDDPFIVKHRSVIHKIGVTGGDVKQRIANAKKDPTYLLADVEIVSTYKLANINPTKLEKLLHKFFDGARLDVELKDRFDIPVKPREWFLVPLKVIEQVIEKIKDGSIGQYCYDPKNAEIILCAETSSFK
ncbi:MAG: GIY-YIG nuclease family protein [Sulfurimonas sp.]